MATVIVFHSYAISIFIDDVMIVGKYPGREEEELGERKKGKERKIVLLLLTD